MSAKMNYDVSGLESMELSETFLEFVQRWIRENPTTVSAIHVRVETALGSVLIEWYAP